MVMSDWESFDFAVTNVLTGDDGTIESLEGRVVKDGVVRDQPIELTAPKAVEYLGYDGDFTTAVKRDGELVPGARITIDENGQEPTLTTESSAEEDETLEALSE
jgi:hypothetical protein